MRNCCPAVTLIRMGGSAPTSPTHPSSAPLQAERIVMASVEIPSPGVPVIVTLPGWEAVYRNQTSAVSPPNPHEADGPSCVEAVVSNATEPGPTFSGDAQESFPCAWAM